MQNWSDVVAIVVLEQAELTKAVLELGRSADACEVRVDLIGRAGPGLVDRTICWTRTSAPTPSARSDALTSLPRQGVLVEATALDATRGSAARIIWHDEEGENFLELSGFACEVEKGAPIEPDDRATVLRRAEIVAGVRKRLAEWRGAPAPDAPRMSDREYMRASEGRSGEEQPLTVALGGPDPDSDPGDHYAPVTHTPATMLEVVTLGELAKLARLQIRAEPCPHQRLPHLYSWLTTVAIPRGTALRRLPPKECSQVYLAGDDCPECAIESALEMEGVAF